MTAGRGRGTEGGRDDPLTARGSSGGGRLAGPGRLRGSPFGDVSSATAPIGLGLGLGLAAGVFFGLVMNQLAVGFVLGIGIGVALGTAFTAAVGPD